MMSELTMRNGWCARRWRVLASMGLLLLGFLSAPICRGDTQQVTLVPALGWDVKKQGGFPVALASDNAGNVWVGTEGNGLWKYDATKKTWTQFTTKDGLGDDSVYALAFDNQRRLWAGHLNHGVSVYNGDKWRNYGLLDGPIGDRVFAIAVSPKDGDVWMATEMGLARYSEKRQDWDYYTRASGLPSDTIQSIAFDDSGELYAGTQCEGIAIAGPDDDYKKWRTVAAPSPAPAAPFGEGLPSDFINKLNVIQPTENASLVVAETPSGGGVTPDGNQWWFMRGQDWQSHTPGPYAAGVQNGFAGAPPTEDWMPKIGCRIARDDRRGSAGYGGECGEPGDRVD
jgi:ligand-binding sensor domain-containing protein